MFKPTQFGKYYLTERIAVGGMAELFKATLFGVDGFEKSMVVKQILPKYSKNDEFIRMFIDEAKIAVTLTHGNIVPVFELGRTDGILFIAMDYVHGHDLAEILESARARVQPLSIEHATYIAIEICKGLAYAHHRTDAEGRPLLVVHRDISPPNILISYDGEVKIADFGIAKAAHKLGNTEAGVVKGTFGYMSPEQVRGLPLDYRTDIFSAGILLHEMLTGRRLFAGDSDIEAIERVKLARVPAPSSINPQVPAELDTIVRKALAREPGDRFGDASELQLALSRVLFATEQGATARTLSQYMRELFDKPIITETLVENITPADDEEPEPIIVEEPTAWQKGKRRRDDTQSFAVRPELDRAVRGPGNGGSRPPMDVGAGAFTTNGTMHYAPLAYEPLPVTEFDEERTNIFSGANKSPPRPQVPELRFPAEAREPTSEAVPFPSTSDSDKAEGDDFPSGQELAMLADQLAGDSANKPSQPRTPGKPSEATERDLRATGPTLPDEPVMKAAPQTPTPAPSSRQSMAAASSGAMAPVSEELLKSSQRPQSRRAGLLKAHRAKKISGLVSVTMRLFVEGLEEEAAPSEKAIAQADTPLAGVAANEGSQRNLTASPASRRTIRPTVLGWILVGLVVVGAGLFVLYKKTHLFGSPIDESGDVLKPEDIARTRELSRPALVGTIKLSTNVEGANFFFFSGETPTVLNLDPGLNHFLRIERGGYKSVNREISPAELAGGKAEILVRLQPVGADAKEEAFEFKESGSKTGRTATLRVTTEPAAAMVWLLVGRGQLEMSGLDSSKTYDFKIVAPGYQPRPVEVMPADFDKTTGTHSDTINLEPETKADAENGKVKTSSEHSQAQNGNGRHKAAEPKPKARPKKIRSKTPRRAGKKATPKLEPKSKTPDWAK